MYPSAKVTVEVRLFSRKLKLGMVHAYLNLHGNTA